MKKFGKIFRNFVKYFEKIIIELWQQYCNVRNLKGILKS